jgi:hypothetical protein
MNEELNPNSAIDKELQIRLMNLAMDEASDFERDQLQSLMEQRPDVTAYYQHVQHLHGLLCVAGAQTPERDEPAPRSDEPWQLPAEKRARLIAFLDGNAPAASSIAPALTLAPRGWPRVSLTLIAVLSTAALLLVGLMLPAVQSARESARIYSQRAAGAVDTAGDYFAAPQSTASEWFGDAPSDRPSMGVSGGEANGYVQMPADAGLIDNSGSTKESLIEEKLEASQLQNRGRYESRGDQLAYGAEGPALAEGIDVMAGKQLPRINAADDAVAALGKDTARQWPDQQLQETESLGRAVTSPDEFSFSVPERFGTDGRVNQDSENGLQQNSTLAHDAALQPGGVPSKKNGQTELNETLLKNAFAKELSDGEIDSMRRYNLGSRVDASRIAGGSETVTEGGVTKSEPAVGLAITPAAPRQPYFSPPGQAGQGQPQTKILRCWV